MLIDVIAVIFQGWYQKEYSAGYHQGTFDKTEDYVCIVELFIFSGIEQRKHQQGNTDDRESAEDVGNHAQCSVAGDCIGEHAVSHNYQYANQCGSFSI